MIKINCWNEYDTLRTVILGNVYDLDRIPNLYQGKDQESFVKIVEETAAELTEIRTVLEQNNVTVLQPKQPANYGYAHSESIKIHSPLLNMRDFYLAYGHWLYLTYGSYRTRRYQHYWMEDIINQLIKDDNFVVSSNEPNLDEIDWNDYKQPQNWGEIYHNTYKDKNLLHTACLLKYNNVAFLRQHPGTSIGKTWLTKMLSLQGIKIVEVGGKGHLDGTNAILNKNTVLTAHTDKSWKIFKNHIIVPDGEDHHKIFRDTQDTFLQDRNPTKWLTDWQGFSQDFDPSINCLSLSPTKVMMSVYNKYVDTELKKLGFEIIYVNWSHRLFWEGGLHCITCDLERYP